MPSPFLGMDPYIESRGLWEDFHQELIGEIKAALAQAVPDRYVVRTGERAYVVLMSPDEAELNRHMTQADVSVSIPRADERRGAAIATLNERETDSDSAPVEMRALVEFEFREAFVEIHAVKPDRRLITTIEVLSPSNKRRDTAGWLRYLRKRQAHLEGSANLVEIDLLRDGTRMAMMDEWPRSPYYLLVSRREKAPLCTVWPAFYTRPLPEIPIPLVPSDPDATLSIQSMMDAIYQRSRYELDIDYRQPCRPELEEDGQQWLDGRLRELGLARQ